jgi:hypothetical protein
VIFNNGSFWFFVILQFVFMHSHCVEVARIFIMSIQTSFQVWILFFIALLAQAQTAKKLKLRLTAAPPPRRRGRALSFARRGLLIGVGRALRCSETNLTQVPLMLTFWPDRVEPFG